MMLWLVNLCAVLVSIAHPKINYFFSNTDYIKRKKGFLNVE